jgi:hypothetical protein
MIEMFEQMAVSAARSVVALFIFTILFMMVFGTVWVRSGPCKK